MASRSCTIFLKDYHCIAFAPLSGITWLYLCGPVSGLGSAPLVYGVSSLLGLPGGSMVKNLPANAGDIRDTSSIPALGGSPGEGNGTPL